MKPARRQLLGGALRGTAVAACGALLWNALLATQARAAAAPLRPPGARPERDFAATCIKCGQCVEACPYQTLKLARLDDATVIGTPYFTPRAVPCFMCADIPCVRNCPTGALDRGMQDIASARMGIAVIDAENCLSWQGLRCEVCFRACPLQGKAITLLQTPRQSSKHAMFEPQVHGDACTGCGLCEKRCPTEIAAIRVVDPALVKGRIGNHYRLGTEAPDARPGAASAAPSSQAPLDYLNRGGSP